MLKIMVAPGLKKFSIERKIAKQKGQTLIEVVVAIALGVIIIVALVNLANYSIGNSNFSKASEQADKLAQDGLELIRNMRDSDDPVIEDSTDGLNCISVTDVNLPCHSFSEMYGVAINGGSTLPGAAFHLHAPYSDSTCSDGNPPNLKTWCLEVGGGEDPTDTFVNNIQYTRQVFIADQAGDCYNNDPNPATAYTRVKQITVKVSWSDPAGNHETTLTTCLGKKA